MNVVRRYPLRSYFVLTFGISWGIAGVFWLWPDFVVTVGQAPANALHPLFRLAAAAPTLAAWWVVAGVSGRSGLTAFWGRALALLPFGAYAACFVGITAIAVGLRTFGAAPTRTDRLDDPLVFIALSLYWVILDPGPLGEESGWRALALPLLQRRFSPSMASVILAAVWSLWHLPAFFISTLQQSQISFVWFVLGNVALTVFMTTLYNASRGNLLLMVVVHWAYNFAGRVAPMDARFYLTYAGAFLVATLILLKLKPATPQIHPVPAWPASPHAADNLASLNPNP